MKLSLAALSLCPGTEQFPGTFVLESNGSREQMVPRNFCPGTERFRKLSFILELMVLG